MEQTFASEVAEKAYQSLMKAHGVATRGQFRLALQAFITEQSARDLDRAYESLLSSGANVARESFDIAMRTFILEEYRSEKEYEMWKTARKKVRRT